MRRCVAYTTVAIVVLLPQLAGATTDVGLSILVENGSSDGLELIRGPRRFVDELDIVAASPSAADEGIDPIIADGDLSNLDWSGVELADEEWRPDGAGTFTRQRFYRGAAWMEQPSFFVVYQVDDTGKVLPVVPFLVFAGLDDLWTGLDGAFVRRFTARQVTTGCAAVGDCSDATGHLAQGLVQLRNAQHPLIDARRIHKKTSALVVYWTADPLELREIPIAQVAASDSEFGYGFGIELEAVDPPSNGDYYLPGDSVTFEVHFTDGEGNPLDDDGALPTFSDFIFDGTESGLRYFDVFLNPTLYYALKHREGNLGIAMAGPTDALTVTDYTVPAASFAQEQIQVAFADEHGFSSVTAGMPPFPVILGGLFDPTVWDTPVTNEVTLTIPTDAIPGTYVVALKARRDFAGEAINTGDVLRLQVGTEEVTSWEPTTDGCDECHDGTASLGEVLHGLGDRESCLAGCHTSLEIEPDAVLDYRVHFIHTRSDRYAADPDDCLVCHVDEPEGIPRGYPGFVFPFD